MIKIFLACVIISIMFFFLPEDIFAHKVNIISWLQGDFIHTESRFNSGKEIQNGKIKVLNSNGQIILTGETNQKGCFSFKINEIDDLEIFLITPCGHKNSSLISKDEIKSGKSMLKTLKNNSITTDKLETKTSYPTLEEIEVVVANQLKHNLGPVLKAISKGQQRKINLQDILGGIGYIIGLIGLASYLKYKQI